MSRRWGQSLARNWPAAAVAALLGLALAVWLGLVLRRCGGQLVYPLDDVYIHMALARRLAGQGVWGVSSFGFAACASSLLWPTVLAALWLPCGPFEAAPLLLNALFAGLLVFGLGRLHARAGHPRPYAFFAILALVLLAPLAPLTFLGMEHVLHALLTLLFASTAAALLCRAAVSRRQAAGLLALAALLGAVRYEAAFLVGAACLLFLLRRRFALAVAVGLAGAAPTVLFGLVSLLHGWHFLPNSVLMKSGVTGAVVFVQPLTGLTLLGHMIDNRCLLVPFVAAMAVLALRLRGRRDPWEPSLALGMLYALAFLPQYVTIQSSFFSRYDAYITALGWAVFFLNLPGALAALRPAAGEGSARRRPTRAAWVLALGALALLPALGPMMRDFALRSFYGHKLVLDAAGNIHDQQIQMARFLRRYYPGAAVAANDIGAINYFGDIGCLDLFGLASVEVLDARRAGRFDAATLAALAERRGVSLAMFYESWLGGQIPPAWRRAGALRMAQNSICGAPEVAVYATRPAGLAPLKARLREFAAQLPPGASVAID